MHPRFQGLTAILLALFAAGPWAVAEDRPVLLLAQAIRAKDLVAVNRLLAEKADPNVPVPGDGRMRTPLLVAVEESTPEITKALLEAGADPKAADDDGDPVIFLAAKAGRLPHAKLLIERGVSIDSRNSEEQTLILRSVHYLEEADARAILGLGANPDLTDQRGRTALMMAAEAGNVALVRVLIEGGAKLDLQDQEGKSALIWTVANSSGASDDKGVVKEIIGLLSKAKANPNLRDSSGQTALMTALDSYWTENEVIEALLAAKPDIAIKNKDGQDALFLAVRGKDRAVHIPKLLELGADIKTTDHHGTDLLMLAARGGNVDLVADLLSRGFSPRALDRTGWNAAHHVADAYISRNDPFSPDGDQQEKVAEKEKRFLEILKLLHKHGAPLDTPDNEGRTPLHLAAMQGNDFAAGFLIPHQPDLGLFDGSGESALHYAAANGSKSMVELFLEKMKQPDLRDLAGATPLQLASAWGHQDTVLLLLHAGADLEAKNPDGNTSLGDAIARGDFKTSRFLIEQGAKPDAMKDPGVLLLRISRLFHDRLLPAGDYAFAIGLLAPLTDGIDRADSGGITPLMWVAASNNLAALGSILDRRPDLDARSPDGRTALMWAAAANASEAMEALTKAGADDSLRDHADRDAAAWAKRFNEVNPPQTIELPPGAAPLAEVLDRSRRKALEDYLKQGAWRLEDRIAGVSPLHLAASLGDVAAITALLERGAPVDLAGGDRMTPLMAAARSGRTAAVEYLLQRGAKPGLRNSEEERAIDIALADLQLPAVRVLLKRADSLSPSEPSLLVGAIRSGNEGLLRELFQAGIKVVPAKDDPGAEQWGRQRSYQPADPLAEAARRDDTKMLAVMADYLEASGLAEPSIKLAALHHAAENGSLRSLRFLIEEQGTDASGMLAQSFGGATRVFKEDQGGYSALSRALEEGHLDIVRYLLGRGVPVAGRTRAGMRPLSFVVEQRQADVLRLLLAHKAPVNEPDLDGLTPLHHAANINDPVSAKLLLEHGANRESRSENGKTPLDFARSAKADAVIPLLEAEGK